MQSKNIINVISPDKQTGKTTVALNTAGMLSIKNYSVCILDLTTNKGATDYFFPTNGPGTSIISWHDVRNCEDAVKSHCIKSINDIYIVPAPALYEQSTLVSSELIQYVVKCIAQYFDYIVIDTTYEFENEVLSLKGIYRSIIVATPHKQVMEKIKDYTVINNINPCIVVNMVNKKNLAKVFGYKTGLKLFCINESKEAIEKAIHKRPRTLPIEIREGKNIYRQLSKVLSVKTVKSKKSGGVNILNKKLGQKRKKPVVEVLTSVQQVLANARSSKKPLVILDANFKKPSLSIAFNVPPGEVWQHDWRTGSGVEPYKVDKGIDLYILDPNIKEFDDRDGDLLLENLSKLYKKYKTVLILGEIEVVQPYLHKAEKALEEDGGE